MKLSKFKLYKEDIGLRDKLKFYEKVMETICFNSSNIFVLYVRYWIDQRGISFI